MTPQEFEKVLLTKAKEVKNYANNLFPAKAGNIALRFINGNFRAGGFQGATFKKWKKSKGTTLVKTGALRAANYYTTQPGQVTLKNATPYAKIHNEGFKGTISIKAHTRNSYGKVSIKTGKFNKNGTERTKTMTQKTGESNVKAHTRKVDIPQRQFMPVQPNDSPVLNNAIEREVVRDLTNMFKN
ncbi:MAG: phage virion morphogenesis protein [Sphingobacteriaceae bacterium]|nr:phage virion morphogenesis protein [Sphingobacteriaceae bacterium]